MEFESDDGLNKDIFKNDSESDSGDLIFKRNFFRADYDSSDDEMDSKPPEFTWRDKKVDLLFHEFKPDKPSIDLAGLGADSNAADFFEYFLDNDMVKSICECTNARYKTLCEQADPRFHSVIKDWRDVHISEMYVFFGVALFMGISRVPDMRTLWSNKPVALHSRICENMDKKRFFSILALLSFTRNKKPDDIGEDYLWKVSPFIEQVRSKFKASFTPDRDLNCTDTLTYFNAGVDILSRPPLDSTCYKTDFYVLVDQASKYILDFNVKVDYQDGKNFYKSGEYLKIVSELTDHFKNKGHTIYLDPCLTSLALLQTLSSNMFNACGGIKPKSPGLPSFGVVPRRTFKAKYADEKILCLKWCNNSGKLVILSTWDNTELIQTNKKDKDTGEPILMPKCVVGSERYNGCDLEDYLLYSVPWIRDTLNWHKKVFFHTLDLITVNSSTLYKKVTGKDLEFRRFGENMVINLIRKHRDTSLSQEHGDDGLDESDYDLEDEEDDFDSDDEEFDSDDEESDSDDEEFDSDDGENDSEYEYENEEDDIGDEDDHKNDSKAGEKGLEGQNDIEDEGQKNYPEDKEDNSLEASGNDLEDNKGNHDKINIVPEGHEIDNDKIKDGPEKEVRNNLDVSPAKKPCTTDRQ